MKALDLDTPNLLSFGYEDSPIPTSRINAFCPWQVNFTFDTQCCLKLREFLGVSNQIETIRIFRVSTVSSFKLEEFKKSFPSPFVMLGILSYVQTCHRQNTGFCWIVFSGFVILGLCLWKHFLTSPSSNYSSHSIMN
ncbi:hypothetical protein Patl1_03928 [Pistacia atlantica]|uniref:Uncharacterized protein n=1 Tax=Pistacia atlantica TaxID=434234 RepID=A0ACC1BWC1_9ROSI|nr:hypothetical protein Patl1_03928 [Pistacia atlantica]